MCAAAVVEIDISELEPGILADQFRSGASAVVIKGDKRIEKAWDRLLNNPQEQLPWQSPLLDIARNHHAGVNITETLGDMYYFKPGRHAHIARKIELSRVEGGEEIESEPSTFIQGDTTYIPDQRTFELCWQISSQIMRAFAPATADIPSYKVAVQRLKYQEQHEDNEHLFDLSNSSLGRWGQIGYAIDRQRETTRGALAPRGVSDLYALLSMARPLRKGLNSLNQYFARRDTRDAVDQATEVIGKAHFDSRFFSGLCGARSNVRTEVLFENEWVEVPIGVDALAVFPGKQAEAHFGIAPILHRVLLDGVGENVQAASSASNVTLLFGAK